MKGKNGSLPIAIPRDRDGSFEPQLVEKHQTHWQGLDDSIILLYARGMSVREIQGHLKELYHTDVSPALISAVTDEVAEDVRQWQSRLHLYASTLCAYKAELYFWGRNNEYVTSQN